MNDLGGSSFSQLSISLILCPAVVVLGETLQESRLQQVQRCFQHWVASLQHERFWKHDPKDLRWIHPDINLRPVEAQDMKPRQSNVNTLQRSCSASHAHPLALAAELWSQNQTSSWGQAVAPAHGVSYVPSFPHQDLWTAFKLALFCRDSDSFFSDVYYCDNIWTKPDIENLQLRNLESVDVRRGNPKARMTLKAKWCSSFFSKRALLGSGIRTYWSTGNLQGSITKKQTTHKVSTSYSCQGCILHRAWEIQRCLKQPLPRRQCPFDLEEMVVPKCRYQSHQPSEAWQAWGSAPTFSRVEFQVENPCHVCSLVWWNGDKCWWSTRLAAAPMIVAPKPLQVSISHHSTRIQKPLPCHKQIPCWSQFK